MDSNGEDKHGLPIAIRKPIRHIRTRSQRVVYHSDLALPRAYWLL